MIDMNLPFALCRWDEVAPLLGGYDLTEGTPDAFAAAGFYADADTLYFLAGWGGRDGDEIAWDRRTMTVNRICVDIASLLVSSWLVQDHDDAVVLLGDEPGSIEVDGRTVPASVIFAPTSEEDSPWENLRRELAA